MVTTRRCTYAHAETEAKRRKKDISEPQDVSRACRICFTESPYGLCVLTLCGHAVCRACALQLKWDAAQADTAVHCSFCRSAGTFIAVKERVIKRNDRIGEMRVRGCDLADEDRLIAEAVAAKAADRAAQAALLAAQERERTASIEKRKAELRLDDAQNGLLLHIGFKFSCKPEAEVARIEALIAGRTVEELKKEVWDAKFGRYDAMGEEHSARAAEKAAMSATRAAERDACKKQCRVFNLIRQLEKENEESSSSGLRYSRACQSCKKDSPRLRSFFPACGHAVCRECADKATATDAETKCTTCRKKGGAIPLFEEAEN